MRLFLLWCSALTVFSQTGGTFSQHPDDLFDDEETPMGHDHSADEAEGYFYSCPRENTYQSQKYILTDLVLLEADHRVSQSIREYLVQVKRARDVVAKFSDRVVFYFEDVPVIPQSGSGWGWVEPVLGEEVNAAALGVGQVHFASTRNTDLFRSREVAMVFFSKTAPQQMVLAQPYARMVNYVDCILGNSPIFLENFDPSDLPNPPESVKSPLTEFQAFLEYENRPKTEGSLTEQGLEDYMAWREDRATWIQDVRVKDPRFLGLLQNAARYVTQAGGGTEELEALSEQFLTRSEQLSVMRSREVGARCGMDQTPRTRLQKIATLALETGRDDIYLRVHLKNLNEQFDRFPDGNHAVGSRPSYFRELEDLGFVLPMFIPGIILNMTDPQPHRYVGSLMRLGRALVEADDPQPLLDILLGMLSDPLLDPPNKWQVTDVLFNFLNHLDKDRAMTVLEEMVAEHPNVPRYFEGLGTYFINQ